jgi:hypothetical protein
MHPWVQSGISSTDSLPVNLMNEIDINLGPDFVIEEDILQALLLLGFKDAEEVLKGLQSPEFSHINQVKQLRKFCTHCWLKRKKKCSRIIIPR